MADSKQQIIQGQPQGFCPDTCPGCGNKCQVESLAISAFNNVTPICQTCWDYEVSFLDKASRMPVREVGYVGPALASGDVHRHAHVLPGIPTDRTDARPIR